MDTNYIFIESFDSSIHTVEEEYGHTGFHAYGALIGSPQNFSQLKIKLIAGYNATLITSAKIKIRLGSKNGDLLTESELTGLSILAENSEELIFYFTEIENLNDDNLFLEIIADDRILFRGLRNADSYGLGDYATSTYADLTSNSSYASVTYKNFNSSQESAWLYCEFYAQESDTSNTEDNDPINDHELFNERVRAYRAKSALIKIGANKQINIAMIGDSWTYRKDITGSLANELFSAYGFAGCGFTVNENQLADNSQIDLGTLMPTVGVSGFSTGDEESGSHSLMLRQLTTQSSGSTIQYVFQDCESIKIHYLMQSSGGSFKWSINGGTETTVSTSGAESVQLAEITGLAKGEQTLLITSVTASSSNPLMILGADSQNSDSGVRIHSLGNGGTTAEDWADVSSVWRQGLIHLKLDVAIIMLGTNDLRANVSRSSFRSNIESIISNVRSANANMDVILMSSSDNNINDDYDLRMSDYDSELYLIALEKKIPYISGFKHLGEFISNPDFVSASSGQSSDLYGMMDELADSFHLSTGGGVRYSDLIVNFLEK